MNLQTLSSTVSQNTWSNSDIGLHKPGVIHQKVSAGIKHFWFGFFSAHHTKDILYLMTRKTQMTRGLLDEWNSAS